MIATPPRIVLALAAFTTALLLGACGNFIADSPIQVTVNAARDHSITTLTTGDASYRSRKSIVVRSSGDDLRSADAGRSSFELHHEAHYERVLPNLERVTVSTWREYPDDPGVHHPALPCESSVVIDITDSFDQVCDGVWTRDAMTRGPADVVADLRKTVDVDALTRVADEAHRGQRVAVYQGFHSENGELKHITFKIGLEDGIIRHAVSAGATVIVEWEHWDIGATDIPTEPALP